MKKELADVRMERDILKKGDGHLYQEKRVIYQFIEIWYNRQRLHFTLDHRTPVEMQDYLTHNIKN